MNIHLEVVKLRTVHTGYAEIVSDPIFHVCRKIVSDPIFRAFFMQKSCLTPFLTISYHFFKSQGTPKSCLTFL